MKIAIDIGGTSTRIAKVFGSEIKDLKIFETDVKNPWTTYNIIKEYIKKASESDKLEGIGLCIPGPLDLKRGMILNTHNLPGWSNMNVLDMFKKDFDVPIAFNNDANIAALGQALVFNKSSVLFVTISTGVGAGFVIDNKILNGYSTTACEIANAIPDLSQGDEVKSGIEFFGSGSNIPRQLKKRGVEVNSAKEAFDLYNTNSNEIINQYFKELEDKLVQFFSTGIYFLNPEILVVGGSVALNNKEFFQKIFKRIAVVTKDISFVTPCEFAKDITNATLLGCAHQ
ncbi:ROK family protein [Spiroplasma tabanidicola]|uniref:Glucokinase n=1 Tax=Spiroplasma tabanidicola TaxID=324079 RepID=A0A6I6CC09_9MOLU|nr:ROK family protein [Spiroplasma tabanidicola]QGS51632.1 glucokinase [Spiroplasma tabanidicola]